MCPTLDPLNQNLLDMSWESVFLPNSSGGFLNADKSLRTTVLALLQISHQDLSLFFFLKKG